MIIHFLDKTPLKSALYTADQFLMDAIRDSLQCLVNAHRIKDGYLKKVKVKNKEKEKWIHSNLNFHLALPMVRGERLPWSLWTMESRKNYIWMYQYFLALLNEFRKRYNYKISVSEEYITILANPPKNLLLNRKTKEPVSLKINQATYYHTILFSCDNGCEALTWKHGQKPDFSA